VDYIILDNSDLKISQLGFGCCPMGGHGWGKISSKELKNAVLLALDKGVNLFDTADVYGFGESERLLGQFLKSRRHEAIIATKFGVRIDNQGKAFYDNSPAWIENALEESLKRLDVDCIDLYQIHYLDGKTPLTDIIGVLENKRLEGKIRYYGFSNITLKDIYEHILPKEMISFQLEYSLANRSNEEKIIKIVQEKKLGFISWGSLGQGMLSGKYKIDTVFPKNDRRNRPTYLNFYGNKFKKNLTIVEEMKRISDSIGKTLPQIAIRWLLDYLGFGAILVGIKNPDQISENVGAFGWHLKQNEVKSLNLISKKEID